MEVFKDYSCYYNALYKEKDYLGEAKVIHNLIETYHKEAKNLLNMGCGTGRHDRELLNYGYKIKGIDISDDMLCVAKRMQKEEMIPDEVLKFEMGDVRNYRDGLQYDAIISLFHVMSYQNSNEDICNALQTAYDELKEDGIFIFDVWYGPGVLTEKPEVRVKILGDEQYDITRISSPVLHPNDNIVDVCFQVMIIDKSTSVTRKIEEIHHMRYFFIPEMKAYLNKAGFILEEVLDCQNMQKPGLESWTVYFVARKPKRPFCQNHAH